MEEVGVGAQPHPGMAVLVLVLATAPAEFGSIPGDFARWMLIFVVLALAGTTIWCLDGRAGKKASTPV